MMLNGSSLIEAVKTRTSSKSGQLSPAAQKALDLSRSLKSAGAKDFCLPSTQSLDGFKAGRLEWAFAHGGSLPTQPLQLKVAPAD